MYLDIFGLRQLPFRLRPDPAFWYVDTAIRRAHDDLQAALRRRDPLTIVSGEAGVGKTLLVEAALAASPAERTVVRINQPQVSWVELTEAIALQLSAAESGGGSPLATLLADAAAHSAPPLLLLDHAHLFAPASLQSLLKLAMGGSRLAIVLQARAGGASPWTETGGIAAAVAPITLRPLVAEHVEAYVESRLRAAGSTRRNLFTHEACAQLFVHTRGVPRAINVLGDLALTLAAARHLERVTESEIREATQDPRWHELRAPEPTPDLAGATDAAPTVRRPNEAAHASQISARIVVVKGTRAVANLALVPGRLQIGRASDNDLALESKYVSRRHCELITVNDGPQVHTILVDLGSRNGTLVNGRRIKRHRLTQGDVVQLGDHELRCLGTDSGDLGGNRVAG